MRCRTLCSGLVTKQLPNVNDRSNSELAAEITTVASEAAPKHQCYEHIKINISSNLNSELGYPGNVNASSISTQFMKS